MGADQIIEWIKKTMVQLLKWSQDHTRKLIVIAGLVIALSIGGVFYHRHVQSNLRAASDLLYRAQSYHETQFETIKSEVRQSRTDSLPRTFIELEGRYLKLIQAHPKTTQAQIAALDLSRIYTDIGRHDQGLEALEMVRFAQAFRPFYWMRKAYLYELVDAPADSEKMWKYVLSDQQFGAVYHQLARVNLARLAYADGRVEEGRQILSEVRERGAPGSLEVREAEKIQLFYDR